MSHTTTIDSVVISDISVLRSTIKELKDLGIKVDLLENAKPRAYYTEQQGMGQAPFVVQVHDSMYDVGLYAKEDGKGYEARADFFMGSVEKVLGLPANGSTSGAHRLGKLFQTYAVQAATKAAVQKGYTVRRTAKADGTIQLVVNGM